jgi:hypothetical protein
MVRRIEEICRRFFYLLGDKAVDLEYMESASKIPRTKVQGI